MCGSWLVVFKGIILHNDNIIHNKGVKKFLGLLNFMELICLLYGCV